MSSCSYLAVRVVGRPPGACCPYHTREWRDRIRPAVIVRDGGRCVRCGRADPRLVPGGVPLEGGQVLIVDHIRPWTEGGAWFDLANLQTLCSRCSGAKDGPRARLLRPGERRGGMVPLP